MTDNPVDLRLGNKQEVNTDLVVRLPGRDFKITRSYSSEPSTLNRRNIIGTNWALPILSVVTTDFDATPPVIQWFHGQNAQMALQQRGTSSADQNKFDGPPNSTLVAEVTGIDALEREEIRIYEPGRSVKVFSLNPQSGQPDREGLLRAEYDNFGNVYEYTWTEAGIDQGGSSGVTDEALTSITISTRDGSGGLEESAVIWFQWVGEGLIGSIKVFRRDPNTTDSFFLTQEVRYTYKSTPTIDFSNDIGEDDDLVQVEIYTRVDGSVVLNESGNTTLSDLLENVGSISRIDPTGLSGLQPINEDPPLANIYPDIQFDKSHPVRKRVLQYRYYRSSTDDGTDDQLRMVFHPEQLEYYEWKTGLDASELLELDNGATAISGESLTVQDLASKIITYDGIDDTYWVTSEILQSSCACGGGSSQGKKLVYTYETDGDLVTAGEQPFGPGDRIVRSTIVEELLEDPSISMGDPYTIPNTTTFYDMTEVDLRGDGMNGARTDLLLKYKAVRDDSDTTVSESQRRHWVTRYDYYQNGDGGNGNPGQVQRIYQPSAMEAYWRTAAGTEYDNEYSDIVDGGSGLVMHYEYATSTSAVGRITAEAVSTADRATTTTLPPDFGTISTVTAYEYFTENDSVSWITTRPDMVKKITRVRIDGVTPSNVSSQGANDLEVTEFDYTFSTSPFDIDPENYGESSGSPQTGVDFNVIDFLVSREISVEKELATENGPDTAGFYTTTETFLPSGEISEIERADGTITRLEYDASTGALVKSIEGYTGATFTGGTSTPDVLTTTYANDLLGRLTAAVRPSGATTSVRREMRTGDHPDDDVSGVTDIPRYTHISFPPDAGSGEFDGPITIRYMDAADNGLGERSYAVSSLSRNTDGEVTAFTLGTELARSYMDRNLARLVTSEIVYHDIDGASGLQSYESEYVHDRLGRVSRVTNPVGTITSFDYDVLDRVISESVGTSYTDETTNNLLTVCEYIYDGGIGSTQGVGDGNLTKIIKHVSASAAEDRETTHAYDFRNRRISTEYPDTPHELLAYDNLDRVTTRALSLTTTATISGPGDADLGRYEETLYSQRGFPYASRLAIDPAASGTGFLESHVWYDEVGRIAADWGPSSTATKYVYDELGRLSELYVTDRGSDASPGASGNYGDATSLTSDIVLEQVSYSYVEPEYSGGPIDATGAGQVELVTTRLRSHTAGTSTGALDVLGGTSHVTMFDVSYHDPADRLVLTASLGTGEIAGAPSTGFLSGGTLPCAIDQDDPLMCGSSPITALSSKVTYNDRGMVDIQTDRDGIETKYFYDDLNRTIAVATNFQNASVSWDAGLTPPRWKVAGLDSNDSDKVTSTVYDGIGNTLLLVSHGENSSDTDAQITEYEFGVTVSTDNLINSKDLLAQVNYPDESNGDPGTTSEYQIHYDYNRQGELVRFEDQGVASDTTEHEYTRDSLGRLTLDHAVSIASDKDDWADRIEYEYDGFDRIARITTLDGPTTIKNEIRYFYDSLWRTEFFVHSPVASVPLNSPDTPGYTHANDTGITEYDFENSPLPPAMGDEPNYTRLDATKYPLDFGSSRTALELTYGSTLDNRISRASGMSWAGASGVHSVEHSFVGYGMTAISDYTNGTLVLDRYSDPDVDSVPNNDTTPGTYPGFDRYGRLVRHVWHKKSAGDAQGDWDPDDEPAIFDLQYSYSDVSDVLTRYDRRAGDLNNRNDESAEYTYDGLHRLTQSMRGEYNPSTTVFTNGGGTNESESSQSWDLDIRGNWTEFDADLTGNGAFTDVGDAQTDRDHNMANEFLGEPGLSPIRNYDATGNRIGKVLLPGTSSWIYKYDAWNRLSKVEVLTGSGPQLQFLDRAVFTYYGEHQRAIGIIDEDGDGSADERSHYYYDASWRMLERRLDDDYGGGFAGAPSTFTREAVHQYVWGNEYIDELCFFQKTAGSSTTNFAGGFGAYGLYDRDYSVIGLFDVTGIASASDDTAAHRTRYSAYGRPFTEPYADVNGDGSRDSGDLLTKGADYGSMTASPTNYVVNADLNLDGTVNIADGSAVSGSAMLIAGEDVVSTVGCIAGFTGMLYEPSLFLYLSRHRWYDAEDGRWINRDPSGYSDGMNLYQYVRGNPGQYTDPSGFNAVNDAVSQHRAFTNEIVALARSGQISVEEASHLVNMGAAAAEGQIREYRDRSARRVARFTAGPKAVVNSAGRTLMSVATLGQVEGDLIPVNEYERQVGYDISAGVARVSTELGFGLAAGAASGLGRIGQALTILDATGNAAMAGEGVFSAATCGLSFENSFQILGGAAGFGGNFAGVPRVGGQSAHTSTSRTSSSLASGFEPHGIFPRPGTRVRPQGIPNNWRIRPTDTSGGTEYYNPMNRNEHVRIMQGNPNSPYQNSRNPYVRQRDSSGSYLDINGNRVSRTDPAGHIPLDQFTGYIR